MKFKSLFFASCWLIAVLVAWRTGSWQHDDNFHMHDPLHQGGMVRMSGQFHLELVSNKTGEHHLWISDAFRQELSTDQFSGMLTVSKDSEVIEEVPLKHIADSLMLVAQTKPLQGEVTIVINGQLGELKTFEDISFFSDYDPHSSLYPPPLGLEKMVPTKISE